jgi:hypothetical protein
VASLYGVWASDGPTSLLRVSHEGNGKIRLDGIKRYCSGAPLLDAALVTAHDEGQIVLLDVPERMCMDVLDRFGRATGPQLLAFGAAIAQRHAELAVYISQCHAERDLATICGNPC